jgi:hypothetical protein
VCGFSRAHKLYAKGCPQSMAQSVPKKCTPDFDGKQFRHTWGARFASTPWVTFSSVLWGTFSNMFSGMSSKEFRGFAGLSPETRTLGPTSPSLIDWLSRFHSNVPQANECKRGGFLGSCICIPLCATTPPLNQFRAPHVGKRSVPGCRSASRHPDLASYRSLCKSCTVRRKPAHHRG